MNWSSFVFAHRLKARLRGGRVENRGGTSFRVTGKLDTPAVFAHVEIWVSADFGQVMKRPPRVWCREEWMRDGEEWHNDAEHGMCWVLENEWCDVFAARERAARDVITVATNWLLNHVTSLVSRHYSATLDGIKRWRKEWNAWPHYDEGVEQYEREQRARTEQRV